MRYRKKVTYGKWPHLDSSDPNSIYALYTILVNEDGGVVSFKSKPVFMGPITIHPAT